MAHKENEVKDIVRMEADSLGHFLYRNQTGALQDKDGRWVRFGLANESKNLNKVLKSGDLIGIAPLVITEAMLGATVGVFVSVEVKKPGWIFGASKQDEGQEAWREHITRNGGFATVIDNEGQFSARWNMFLSSLSWQENNHK